MKTDTSYSHIDVCPDNEERLYHDEHYEHDGVCPRCGNQSNGLISHHKQIVGRWNRPSFWEKLLGKQPEFLLKSEEDAVMNALKGDHLA